MGPVERKKTVRRNLETDIDRQGSFRKDYEYPSSSPPARGPQGLILTNGNIQKTRFLSLQVPRGYE